MRKSILLCFIFFVFFAASVSATPQDIIDCMSRENKRFENCNPSEVGDLYEYKGNCDVYDYVEVLCSCVRELNLKRCSSANYTDLISALIRLSESTNDQTAKDIISVSVEKLSLSEPPGKPDENPREEAYETIIFGKFEQDGNIENGPEPLEWRILSEEDGKMLIMTDKAIVTGIQYFGGKPGDWENSRVRKYLNEDFFNTALSFEEQNAVVFTPHYATGNGSLDPSFDQYPDNDYIFLLSDDEIRKYLPNLEDRRITASASIFSGVEKIETYVVWMSRSNYEAINMPGMTSEETLNNITNGLKYSTMKVLCVNPDGKFVSLPNHETNLGIVPSAWVSLTNSHR